MEEPKEAGIIGFGKATVDTDSEEFKVLQQKIIESSKKLTPIQRIEDKLFGIRFRMEDYLSNEENKTVIPVGHFLKDCVLSVGIPHRYFANYIGMNESNLNALYKGRRKINTGLALKLEKIFKIKAGLWLFIQHKNELLEMKSEIPKMEDFSLEGLVEGIK